MFEINRVLVIIEAGREEQPALTKALQMAECAGAELELMTSDFNSYLEDGFYFDPVQARDLRRRHGEDQLAELETLAAPLREQGLEVSCVTAWGNPPYEQIVDRVNTWKPDLVVKSTRHHNRLVSRFLANEDWELIRYCPSPLLLVKDREWATVPVFVAAVDPGHQNEKPAGLDHKLIATGRSLARLVKGELHLYHSSHLVPLSGLYPVKSNQQMELQDLVALAKEYDLSKDRCHLSDAEIGDSLPALVDELQVSAVLMGAVSRSHLDRLLIGNTAEKVLDRLDCDVLVVKPEPVSTLSR
ncbi:MAG: universal stress protein [Pseudohongiellaceae bacterium]